MIRRILALFRRDRSAMIARRAMRLHNRNADGAKAYERVHLILSRGRR